MQTPQAGRMTNHLPAGQDLQASGMQVQAPGRFEMGNPTYGHNNGGGGGGGGGGSGGGGGGGGGSGGRGRRMHGQGGHAGGRSGYWPASQPYQPRNYNAPYPSGYNHYYQTRLSPSVQYQQLINVGMPQNFGGRQSQQQQQAQPPNAVFHTSPVPPSMSGTPSSTQSSQVVVPQHVTSPMAQAVQPVRAQISPQPVEGVATAPPQEPFRPPLPWLSRPDEPFPKRKAKSKGKKRIVADISLPVEQLEAAAEAQEAPQAPGAPSSTKASKSEDPSKPSTDATSPVSSTSRQTVADSNVASGPSTLSSAAAAPSTPTFTHTPVASNVATPTNGPKAFARTVAAVPIVPAIPKTSPKASRPASGKTPTKPAPADTAVQAPDKAHVSAAAPDQHLPTPEEKPASPVQAAPKSWASLLMSTPSNAAKTAALTTNGTATGTASTNGVRQSEEITTGSNTVILTKSGSSSLAETLRSYRVGEAAKVAFIEPRGLINTGNMCYMNSVLQVLVFCAPFYDFLDQVSKQAAHSFKSETPLIDAMVLFLREFKVIDAATSTEQLRRRLKVEELEQHGEPFTPEFVYDVIRKLPRFVNMRRGHQQDAEEFLGFLLQSLDDECTQLMGFPNRTRDSMTSASSDKTDTVTDTTSDWLEVGRRQRSAVTRSSGFSSSSPVAKIFGGLLRSEFRVPGLKDSITTEAYQPLQLDIGSPKIRNIIDALKGLTTIETIHGDFGSPRGQDTPATKQVFIDTLPPVLILHLKRFQFDAQGHGTVKLWKQVGYPLELEIPREVFSRQKRNALLAEGVGMPRYKLVAVVYHHGKNASGGHYTVDVRRQDGLEWVRLDDTVIRRVRSQDVAEAGAEEPPSRDGPGEPAQAAARSSQSAIRLTTASNDEGGDDSGWKQVSSSVNGGKRWSSVVNGNNASTAKGKQSKENNKDNKDNKDNNKVAYILFYQRA